jgi:hypothetical protein
MASNKDAALPQRFKIGLGPTVVKLEGGIHYSLVRRADKQWYYSAQREATRPLPRNEQARLNMLAEHYERQLEILRQRLVAAGLDSKILLDPVL